MIERSVGPKQAQLLGQMAFEGGRIIRERVAKYNIQCDLKDGGVFAALTPKQMGHLESQKRLWERFGHTSLSCSISAVFAKSSAVSNTSAVCST